jgi:hypothetical protein
VDESAAMISQGRVKPGRRACELSVLDATTFMPEGPFDAALLIDTWEFLANPAKTFWHVRGVLRAGALAFIVTPHPAWRLPISIAEALRIKRLRPAFGYRNSARRVIEVAALAGGLTVRARVLFRTTGQATAVFGETRYAAKSWGRKRRVITKAEVVQYPGRAPRQSALRREQSDVRAGGGLRGLPPAGGRRESLQGAQGQPGPGAHRLPVVPGQPVPRPADGDGLHPCSRRCSSTPRARPARELREGRKC